MKTFADVAIPVYVVIWTAAIVGAFVITCRRMRQVTRRRRNPCPVPARVRLRELRRLAWYRLTRRMPRYEGRHADRIPLTVREWRAFDAIRSAERRRQPFAPEPQYRRQP